ncbi:uncharacterized protein [Dermacentor andersoni]|uniref:uncharacterized protein isoform X4 n=1 Tax=Dermacentor andersoni TaxID=34620 RepID=UPI002416CF59|nr:uncharacterized protein LOC126544382 isoform X4 [Dermacentor andersoni]
MSLRRIFPFSQDDIQSRVSLDSTETFILGDDPICLNSLALQLAVTSAEAGEYVAIVGCSAIETVFHVHGMPAFSEDMVDFIRPRFMGDLKSLFNYLTKFQQLPVHPNVLILHGLEAYIQETSEEENGDQTIARLFALVQDAANFATSKNKLEDGRFTLQLDGRLPTTVLFGLSKRELCLQRVDCC